MHSFDFFYLRREKATSTVAFGKNSSFRWTSRARLARLPGHTVHGCDFAGIDWKGAREGPLGSAGEHRAQDTYSSLYMNHMTIAGVEPLGAVSEGS